MAGVQSWGSLEAPHLLPEGSQSVVLVLNPFWNPDCWYRKDFRDYLDWRFSALKILNHLDINRKIQPLPTGKAS